MKMPFERMERMRTSGGITYYVCGKGDQAVLCHPSLGLGRFLFHRMVPALSREFVMVTWDPRGTGDNRDFAPDMASWVSDALDILGEVGLPAHLLGVSLGTWVMARAAAANPAQQVLSLALIGATPGFVGQGQDVPDRRAQLYATGMSQFAAEYARSTLTEYALDEVRDNLAAELAGADVENYLQAMAAIYAESNEAVYPEVGVPTLIMVGARDARTSPAQAEQVRQLVPHSELKVLPRCGHLALLDQPERVLRECRYFWRHRHAADD